MASNLGKTDLEELSAFLDGELSGQAAARVERLVRDEPAWGQAHRELLAVDDALDAYTVGQPPDGLADRVLAGVRRSARRSRVIRVAAWVAPAAAVAAVLLLALAVVDPPTGTINREIETSAAYRNVPQGQRVELEAEIVRHYGMLRGLFREQDVIEDFETLEAIERLEQEGT